MSLECNERLTESEMELDLDFSKTESVSPEERDGVYIVRSIDFFFLVTVRLTGVNFDDSGEKTSEYEINCIPTPTESPVSNENIPTRPCVQLSVIVGAGDRPTSLDILRYDKNCSLVGHLHKKTGTEQMLMSTLAFAAKMFDKKIFYFTDASTIECENVKSISLRDYGLLVEGKTWYERNYDATMYEPEDFVERDHYKAMLNTIISEEQSQYLIEGFRLQSFLTDDELTRYIYIVKKSAENGKTWQQMIQQVSNHETRGCSFFSFYTVDQIMELLGLRPLLSYKIEITDERASHFVKANQKIY